jgi:hypothetical protein
VTSCRCLWVLCVGNVRQRVRYRRKWSRRKRAYVLWKRRRALLLLRRRRRQLALWYVVCVICVPCTPARSRAYLPSPPPPPLPSQSKSVPATATIGAGGKRDDRPALVFEIEMFNFLESQIYQVGQGDGVGVRSYCVDRATVHSRSGSLSLAATAQCWPRACSSRCDRVRVRRAFDRL